MLIKRKEYYVRYTDTKGRKYSSLIFPMKETAEEFKKAMLSQGAVEANIYTQEYLYEEKD